MITKSLASDMKTHRRDVELKDNMHSPLGDLASHGSASRGLLLHRYHTGKRSSPHICTALGAPALTKHGKEVWGPLCPYRKPGKGQKTNSLGRQPGGAHARGCAHRVCVC